MGQGSFGQACGGCLNRGQFEESAVQLERASQQRVADDWRNDYIAGGSLRHHIVLLMRRCTMSPGERILIIPGFVDRLMNECGGGCARGDELDGLRILAGDIGDKQVCIET